MASKRKGRSERKVSDPTFQTVLDSIRCPDPLGIPLANHELYEELKGLSEDNQRKLYYHFCSHDFFKDMCHKAVHMVAPPLIACTLVTADDMAQVVINAMLVGAKLGRKQVMDEMLRGTVDASADKSGS